MRRVIRREIRGTRSARCNSEILSSMLIPPASAAAAPVSPVLQQQQAKTYALVLPSSTLTAPIGSKNNDRPCSALHLPPIPPAATAALSAQQQQTTPQQHSPFYLYMSDVPRNRHYESLESLQHDRYTSEFAASSCCLILLFSSRAEVDRTESGVCVLCCLPQRH